MKIAELLEADVKHGWVNHYPRSAGDYALQAVWNYIIPRITQELEIPKTRLKSTAIMSWHIADGGSLTMLYGPISKFDNPDLMLKVLQPKIKKELEHSFAKVEDVLAQHEEKKTAKGSRTMLRFKYNVWFPESWKKRGY